MLSTGQVPDPSTCRTKQESGLDHRGEEEEKEDVVSSLTMQEEDVALGESEKDSPSTRPGRNEVKTLLEDRGC